jgi:hypothetical protein
VVFGMNSWFHSSSLSIGGPRPHVQTGNDRVRCAGSSSSCGVSLECGGLPPLWPRSSVIDNKAAASRRTPRRRRTYNLRESFLAFRSQKTPSA